MHRQPSLFGVEANDPAPGDLAGLLAGPGTLGRMGGTARVSVVVDAAWRVHVLVAELVRRGLTASWQPAGEGRYLVRTAYSIRLAGLARAWSGDGTGKRPPVPLHLAGHALRLWVAAAGSASPGPTASPARSSPPGGGSAAPDGYELRLGPDDQMCWSAVGAALHAAGLSAALLSPVGGPPAYRITGRRRLERLAELVGPPPDTVPPGAWPAVPGRR